MSRTLADGTRSTAQSSIVRDFLQDEAVHHQDRTLRRHFKPDLLLIDDMGLKALTKNSGE